MKKKIYIKSMFIMILILLLNNKVASEGSAAKTIKLVCDPYPPYAYEEKKEIKGIVVEIVMETFKRMGYKPEISIYPWARAIDMVKTGKVDAMLDMYKTEEREKFIDFSSEIMQDAQCFFVLKDSKISFDGDLIKLKKYKIGVINGYSYGKNFNDAVKANQLNIEKNSDATANYKKLAAKRIDIYIEGKYVFKFLLQGMGKSDTVKELSPEVSKEPLYLGFSKKNNLQNTIVEFNKALKKVESDGTKKKIISKYIK